MYKILCDVHLCAVCAYVYGCVSVLLLKFNWNILNKFTQYTLFNDCAINKFNYWFMWFTLLNTFILLKSQALHSARTHSLTHNSFVFA